MTPETKAIIENAITVYYALNGKMPEAVLVNSSLEFPIFDLDGIWEHSIVEIIQVEDKTPEGVTITDGLKTHPIEVYKWKLQTIATTKDCLESVKNGSYPIFTIVSRFHPKE